MNEQDPKTLGQQIRAARKARKWRQQDLADAADVSLGTIQNLEGGKRNTQPSNLIAVRAVLELPGLETETIAGWPTDVKVITDMVGAWLVAQSPADRERFALEMTRRIIGSAPSSPK